MRSGSAWRYELLRRLRRCLERAPRVFAGLAGDGGAGAQGCVPALPGLRTEKCRAIERGGLEMRYPPSRHSEVRCGLPAGLRAR